jgi:hypothetical protein
MGFDKGVYGIDNLVDRLMKLGLCGVLLDHLLHERINRSGHNATPTFRRITKKMVCILKIRRLLSRGYYPTLPIEVNRFRHSIYFF